MNGKDVSFPKSKSLHGAKAASLTALGVECGFAVFRRELSSKD